MEEPDSRYPTYARRGVFGFGFPPAHSATPDRRCCPVTARGFGGVTSTRQGEHEIGSRCSRNRLRVEIQHICRLRLKGEGIDPVRSLAPLAGRLAGPTVW